MSPYAPETIVRIDPCAKTIFEVVVDDPGSAGTLFPYGPQRYRAPYLDGHRESYSDADAQAVADMVNRSSWLKRNR